MCLVLYTRDINHNERETMNYTTASFETGSEFRVHWIEISPNPRRNSKHADIITIKDSDIFTTYEQAQAFRSELNNRNSDVMVRRPGNKNFRRDRDTKTV
jgi:hypothetical protein